MRLTFRTGKSPSSGKVVGTGCFVLFAGVFLAVGLFIGGMAIHYFFETLQARSWVDVPATILEADLEENTDSDGATTYKVVARYRYRFEGQTYESTRVAFGSGSDNIGSFHQDAFRKLKTHRDSGDPFMARVNPDAPDEAVLYPQLRVGMLLLYLLFGLVFGGAGAGLLLVAVYGYRKSKVLKEREKQHPGEPWLAREEWAQGRVVDSAKAGTVMMIVFAVFWNLISFPIAFLVGPEERAEAGKMIYLIYIFPAIGIFLMAGAAYVLARFLKYGRSVFEMSSVPGVIGGPLAGIIYTKRNIVPEDGFHLSLSCIRRRTSGSGDNRSTHESVLWQDERIMARDALESDLTRSAIPVLFAIPYGEKDTDDSNPNDEIQWRLNITAKTRGIDYKAQFQVPVFKTKDSLEAFELDESAIAQYVRQPDAEQDIRAIGARRVEMGSGSIYTFPPARQVGVALGVTAFFAIWTGAVWLMLSLGAPFFFIVIFGLVDIILARWFLHSWLYTTRIETYKGGMRVARGYLLPGSPVEIPIEDLKSISLDQSMTSGNKVYYSMKAVTRSGKRYSLAGYIDNKRQAQTLIDEMQREMRGD